MMFTIRNMAAITRTVPTMALRSLRRITILHAIARKARPAEHASTRKALPRSAAMSRPMMVSDGISEGRKA